MKFSTRYLLPLFLLALQNGYGQAESSKESTPDPEVKGYHFFVGANLRIPHEDNYFPVERIWNARALIKVEDSLTAQRVRDIKEIKVDRQAKVSSDFAEITELTCEPVYSVARDPRTIAAQQQVMAISMASAFSDEVDSSYRQSANPNAFIQAPESGLNTKVSGDFDTELQQNEGAAMDFLNASGSGDVDTTPARPMWDMLHVQFSISTNRHLPSGHLVFIFQLTDHPEGEPVMSWFHFLSLSDLSPEAKSYDYRLADYPDGMYIASQEAFLFTNGSEVATNLSAKLVNMTERDARVFLRYQYLTQNSGKTRPPGRAWKYLDPELRADITPDLKDQTITLKLDADGRVQDILTSHEVQSALKPKGLHAIASLIYLPALEDGKPVAGELTLALKDLVLD